MSSLARTFGTAAAALALACVFAPATGWAEAGTKTLRFIPQADLRSIDPIWTTAYVTRNFGYMVFDTLFALDKDFKPQPQMVDRWTVSDDKLDLHVHACATASNGMTASRCAPPIASPRSNAGASATRSARS